MRSRFSFRLVLPALLMLLVAVFAALQYRWLGQVSEADREQMRRALSERARQFASDFDREVTAVHSSLRVTGDITDPDAGARAAQRMTEWRSSARFPEMVRNVYVIRSGGFSVLYRVSPDRGTFDLVGWPESLLPVRARLPRAGARDALIDLDKVDQFVQMPLARLPPVMLEVPALVMPPAPSTPLYTIVELDRDAIRQRVLPALAAQHFLQVGSGDRLVILDEKGAALYSSGADADRIASHAADASAPLFQVQTEAVSAVIIRSNGERIVSQSGSLPRPDVPAAGSEGRRSFFELTGRVRGVTSARSTWTLLVQHPAGSIDAAVTAARRRNLWLSFGILALLTAGMVLVLINARRSQQLAAQQMDFVATVSHELRTPVAVMRSAAQNLSAGVVHDPERARRYGELIETEGRRLTDMLEQVLEFAGLDGHRSTMPLVPVNAAEIALDAVAACRPLIESHGLKVDFDVEAGTVPMVMGHPDALRSAVTNLLTNAVKYGGDGGWIGVVVRQIPERGKGAVVIAVSDRGRGVDQADLPKLFDPFFRGRHAIDRQIQGSGLGLSLVHRTVDAFGGRVHVHSGSGAGATFSIHLPAVESRPETDAARDPVPAGGRAS